MTITKLAPKAACPCGSDKTIAACCGSAIDGGAVPLTAKDLMRSRYTAYALGDAAYVLATWHASTRPAELDLKTPPQPEWVGLEVVDHQLQDTTHATVEFVARSRVNGRAHRMHELSRFVREDGRWFYVDGDQR